MLADDLICNRALTCDNERIVEWMDEREARFRRKTIAMDLGFGVMVSGEHDFGIERLDGFHLDFRCRLRHHDHRANPKMLSGKRNALRMIARAGRDDADRTFGLRQPGDTIVGPSNFEAEDRLLVFAF